MCASFCVTSEYLWPLTSGQDEKAGQYLAVYLKDDAKAFYHKQQETVRKSFSELSKALKKRYEGGLALLKYKREFNSRSRKEGEPLHSFLADLRLAYDRAYAPPTVDELPETPNTAQKKVHNEQLGALAFYETRKGEDVLCQFINGLKKDLREVLNNCNFGGREGTVEQKLGQLTRSTQVPPLFAAVRRGGKWTGRQRHIPRPTDICRACNGRGHWARSCPTLNANAGGWPRTPTPALDANQGVNYPYRSQKEPIINTVHKASATYRKSYHVEGTVNEEKSMFLVDTGAEMSMISSSAPGLVVKESRVAPVSITHQPITVRGKAVVELKLGDVQTQWTFLVVDDLKESVLGADFIDSHHESSWGVRDGALWLDDWKTPLINPRKCSKVLVDDYSPVVARCTVELPARHQMLIPMRTKDGDSRAGLFESKRTPGGVLMSKTVVDGDKKGGFWVKAVNLSDENVTLFKNQKIGILTDIDDCSEPFNLAKETDCPTVSYLVMISHEEVSRNLALIS
ncbi:hypothetical protein OS493_007779 [Desmophyllum pertusum]|uniref:CCHC-type domain-containing protein n=1 Tax=Desmophyllum pertusum TaxID=174260 RepID=A0A9X0CM21_9CNID|nr:hypothetical protein OS493_007779 [Desmophyllum pertusum]